jgi:hypothetical protein
VLLPIQQPVLSAAVDLAAGLAQRLALLLAQV